MYYALLHAANALHMAVPAVVVLHAKCRQWRAAQFASYATRCGIVCCIRNLMAMESRPLRQVAISHDQNKLNTTAHNACATIKD